MTIKQALTGATQKLQEACERPRYEAELLLAYYLKRERLYLMTHDDEPLLEPEGYEALIARRADDEPYEYIVQSVSFYDIHLFVKEGVLIPRPETEILIDLVAEIIEKEHLQHIAEIGVGSGAISVVLARKFPHLKIIATDICHPPLEVAQKNLDHFALTSQVTLRHSHLIDEVSEPLELVVSNPPYIAEDFLLERNVVAYEPKEALFGGREGDELLKEMIVDVQAKGVRWLCCEMGYDQKEPISRFVNQLGVQSLTFYKDLAGLDRGFILQFF